MRPIIRLTGPWFDDRRHDPLLLALAIAGGGRLAVDAGQAAAAQAVVEPFRASFPDVFDYREAGGAAARLENDCVVRPRVAAALIQRGGSAAPTYRAAGPLDAWHWWFDRTGAVAPARSSEDETAETAVSFRSEAVWNTTSEPIQLSPVFPGRTIFLLISGDLTTVAAVGRDAVGRAFADWVTPDWRGGRPFLAARPFEAGGGEHAAARPHQRFLAETAAANGFVAAVRGDALAFATALNATWAEERGWTKSTPARSAAELEYADLRGRGAAGGRPTARGTLYVAAEPLLDQPRGIDAPG